MTERGEDVQSPTGRFRIHAAANDQVRDARTITVMLISPGDNVQLLRCLRVDADVAGLRVRIVTTDEHPEQSAACLLADLALAMPSVDHRDYPLRIADAYMEHGVDLALPCAIGGMRALDRMIPMLAGTDCRLILLRNGLSERVLDRRHWQEMAEGAGATCSDDGIARGRAAHFAVQILFDHDRSRGACCVASIELRRRSARSSALATTRNDPTMTAVGQGLARQLAGAAGPLYFNAILDEGENVRITDIRPLLGGFCTLLQAAGVQVGRWLISHANAFRMTTEFRYIAGARMVTYPAPIIVLP